MRLHPPVVRVWVIASTLALLTSSACRTPGSASRVREGEDAVATASPTGPATVTYVGLVPARYLGSDGAYGLASVDVRNGVITAITPLPRDGSGAEPGPGRVVLKTGDDFDVIYPGMLNLHNHTKQNVLPVWGEAKGQFANRFEWRDWGNYTKAVSYNMNPWIDGQVPSCAAFRWSELQAMVQGTTYLQGPSSCIDNFTIHQVEDGKAYLAEGDARLQDVQAPTDLVVPEDMTFVWKHLKPLIDGGKTYEQALKQKIHEICPRLVAENNIQDVLGTNELNVFKDKAKVIAGCDGDPDKFVRFLNWQHKTIAGKRRYFAAPGASGMIVHLSEGRRKDPYNTIELDIVRLFGLDQPHVNFVHAVGVDRAGFDHMAAHKMGIIWSPFSNLLLYGETLDVKTAIEAGVKIAIGSDWTPTGSRGVLDELKVARAYVRKSGLNAVVTDERLFEMATENAATMLNHDETSASDGRHGVGTIKVDAAASFVVMTKRDPNPYTNFVTADTKDIQLVTIDGRPVYGEVPYIKQWREDVALETLPLDYPAMAAFAEQAAEFPQIPDELTKEEKTARWAEMLRKPEVVALQPSTSCGFAKAMVKQTSGEELVESFKAQSGVDLDSAAGIHKVLALGVLTQSWNRNPSADKGDRNFAVKAFPSMFGCDDPAFKARAANFVNEQSEAADEISENLAKRKQRRKDANLGKGPKKLAENYGLPYDASVDY